MLSRFEQFSFVVSGINRYIQKLERDEMVKYGYKGAYAQYLAVMNRYADGLTAAQLCEVCDKDKAAVSRITAEMESRGLIERENVKYRAKLKLTAEGKRAAEFVCRKAQTAVETVGNELTAEERATFYATLDLIAAKLQILSKEGIPEENSSQESDGREL